jgi:DNA-binding IclR family transcriptional regulator
VRKPGQKRAGGVSNQVLDALAAAPDRTLTPHQLWVKTHLPTKAIRAALTHLRAEDLVEQLDEQGDRDDRRWRLVKGGDRG